MPIQINATCEVAKSFSVKREKIDDGTEIVVAHLKVADVMLDREQIDEIVGLPIGWSHGALFDECGAPLARLSLVLARKDLTLTGVIRGGPAGTSPALNLRDAEISGITLDLTRLGALLSCGLAWEAAGDEVDDIADMLGKTCAITATIADGGQGDLLRPVENYSVNEAMKDFLAPLKTPGIDSVEILDGDGNTVAKIEKPGKRRERAPA